MDSDNNNNQGDSSPTNQNTAENNNGNDDNFQTNIYYINYSFTIPEGSDGNGPNISDLAGLFGFGNRTGNDNAANNGATNAPNTFWRSLGQQFAAGATGTTGTTGGNGPTTTTGTGAADLGNSGSGMFPGIPNIEFSFTNIFQDDGRPNSSGGTSTSADTTTPNAAAETPLDHDPEPTTQDSPSGTNPNRFWQQRFNTDGTTNANGDTVFYTTGTFPIDIRIPVGSNLFAEGGSRKARASDRAVGKLKEVDLDSLPESERVCPICFEDYERLKKDFVEDKNQDKSSDTNPLDDPMDDSEDPPLSIPGSTDHYDDPSESVPEVTSSSTPSSSSSNTTSHNPVEMPCKHQFGNSCIKEWLSSSNTCPLCRTTVESQNDYLRSIGQPPESDNLATNLFDLIFNVIPGLMGQREQPAANDNDNNGNNNSNANTDDRNDNINDDSNDRNNNVSNDHEGDTNNNANESRESTINSSAPSAQSSNASTIAASTAPNPQRPVSSQFLRPLSVFLQNLQNRGNSNNSPIPPRSGVGPVRSNASSPAPFPSSNTAPTVAASSTVPTTSGQANNIRGGGTGGGVWMGPAGILSSWGPRWARRHHPYRSPAATSEQSSSNEETQTPGESSSRAATSSRSASRNAEINDHRDLQCASASLALCVLDSHDEDEQEEDPHRIVRLQCGHGYHIPCLRVGMRAHGDREIPNLTGGVDSDDGATRQVWCMRCRRYQDVSNDD